MSFYRSAAFVSRHGEQIVGDALGTLDGLKTSLEKEIIDLKRYRQKLGQTEVYIYADRIERREQLIAEIVKISEKVRSIGEEGVAFSEFYGYFRGEKNFSALGSGEDFVDVVRFFYRETVRKQKLRYGLKKGAMYPSDAYALCTICALLGRELTPRYSFVFVDEAQDISPGEYDLLRKSTSTLPLTCSAIWNRTSPPGGASATGMRCSRILKFSRSIRTIGTPIRSSGLSLRRWKWICSRSVLTARKSGRFPCAESEDFPG